MRLSAIAFLAALALACGIAIEGRIDVGDRQPARLAHRRNHDLARWMRYVMMGAKDGDHAEAVTLFAWIWLSRRKVSRVTHRLNGHAQGGRSG